MLPRYIATFVLIVSTTATASQAATVTLQAGLNGQPATIIQDAMLVQEVPNDNFGGRNNFEVGVTGNGQVRTAIMRFDVTDPSLGLFVGGVPQFQSIDSITLRLTTTGQTAHQSVSNNMDLRIAANDDAQGDWVEGTGSTASDGGDAGTVTYSERREGQSTGWNPNTNWSRNDAAGRLATVNEWPGLNSSVDISLTAPAGSTLDDLINGWATGNNEGIFLNDINRGVGVFVAWFFHSSESTTLDARPMLTIDFTPIPEPSTYILGLLGAVAVGMLIRRRK